MVKKIKGIIYIHVYTLTPYFLGDFFTCYFEVNSFINMYVLLTNAIDFVQSTLSIMSLVLTNKHKFARTEFTYKSCDSL